MRPVLVTMTCDSCVQAKKSNKKLDEVTHKVYFDIEIDGEAAGTLTCPQNQ